MSPGATYTIDVSTACQSVTTLTYTAPSSPTANPPSCQPLQIIGYDQSYNDVLTFHTSYVPPFQNAFQKIRFRYRISGATGAWQEKDFTLYASDNYTFFITGVSGTCYEVQIATYCDNGTGLSNYSQSYTACTIQ